MSTTIQRTNRALFESRQPAFGKSAAIYRQIFDDNMTGSSMDSLSPFLIDKVLKVLAHESAKKNCLKFSSVFIAQMSMQDHQNSVISKATTLPGPKPMSAYLYKPKRSKEMW